MTVDSALIDKLERLSKIRLSSSETDEVKAQLEKMLEMVESINGIDDCDDDAKLCSDGEGALREDAAKPSDIADSLRENAGGIFSVPTTVE